MPLPDLPSAQNFPTEAPWPEFRVMFYRLAAQVCSVPRLGSVLLNPGF